MKNIGWVVPFPSVEGSGGIATIFNHIKMLEGLGEQTVYVNKTPKIKSKEKLLDIIGKYYGYIPANIVYGHNIAPGHDLLISTFTLHAFRVRKIYAKKKIWFAQDFEELFVPIGAEYFYIKEAYSYGFKTICIGKYMQRKLKEDYDIDADYFDFTVDRSIYKVNGNIDLDYPPSICFLYQPDKTRRCADLGIKALKILKLLIPELTVYLYGYNGPLVNGQDIKEFINLGLLKPTELADLYNRCRLGICFSPTNPSRIPFEMQSCGLPVLDLPGDNKDDFMFDGQKVILEAPSTKYEEIAIYIHSLLHQPQKLTKYSELGLKFIKDRDNYLVYNQFRSLIEEELE